MQTDRFTKSCLLVMTLLLAIIAVRPGASAATARAANHPQYAVEVAYDRATTSSKTVLNRYAAQGWELVETAVLPGNSYEQQPTQIVFVFRK
jgi:hypothetical protein